MKLFCIAPLILFTVGCATGRVQVSSSPAEAEVFVSKDGRAPEKLGSTPLNLTHEQVFAGAQDYIQVEVKKEGFLPESVLVPHSLFGTYLDVSLRLTPAAADAKTLASDNVATIQRVVQGVARAQALTAQKNYERAEAILQSLVVEFPQVSVFHDLLGNIYFLQKDMRRALNSYEESLRLDPNNLETERLVRRLRAMGNNSRLPSSGGL